MISVINKPEMELETVQCYKCKNVFKVHPMVNVYSPSMTDCEKHKQNYVFVDKGDKND